MNMYTLDEIIYESVTPEYGWGRYGDFKVLIRKSDGYINLTKLCKDGGKELSDWTRLKCATFLLNELKASPQICGDGILTVVVGGANVEIRGTYGHPLLAPHVASWTSPAFAVKVSYIVNDHIVRSYREQIRVKDTRIDELIEETRKQREENQKQTLLLQEQKEENQKQTAMIEKQSNEIQVLLAQSDYHTRQLDIANENTIAVLGKLGAASDRVVPRDRISHEKQECLYIVHVPGDALPYHVISFNDVFVT